MKKTNTTITRTQSANPAPKSVNGIPENCRIIAEGEYISNDTSVAGCSLNDMIIGPTGSGKTGSYVVGQLVHPSGSLVVSDTKGRLHKAYGAYLKKLGYSVHVINLVNPGKSNGYNPLQFIRKSSNGRYNEKDIKTLASTICPVTSLRDPFWEQSASRYIAMLIAYVLEALDKSEQTLLSVCEMNRAFASGEGKSEIVEWTVNHCKGLCAKKYREVRSIEGTEKTWSCILEFANNALDPFDYAEFSPVFEKARSFDFRNLGRKKSVLFLITSDNDSTYDRITNVLHTQLLQTLIDEADKQEDGMLKVPCRIILDDFAASAKIEEFSRIISIIRSRNISVSVILQSKTQLEGMYGKCDAANILNNCGHILYLGGSDLETADFISTHLNLTRKTVLTIDRNKAVLIAYGKAARIVNKIRPYSMKPELPEPEDNLAEAENESHEKEDRP